MLVGVASSGPHTNGFSFLRRLFDWIPMGVTPPGFDVELGGNQTAEAIRLMRLSDAFIPAIASAIAIWAIASYPITEEKAHEVRMQLEARRGTV